MTAATPLVFPGSRALGGWWRALAARRPLSLWVGHFLLHHVEALVRVHRSRPPDRFAFLVLQALLRAPERTLPGIDRLLHLGPRVLQRVLDELSRDKLAEAGTAGEWRPTSQGLQVLRGEDAQGGDERRVFHFVGGPVRPHFVPVTHAARTEATFAGDEPFDPAILRACVDQPADWKQKHGFPLDVEDVLAPDASAETSVALTGENHYSPGASPSWRRVIVAHPERLLAVLVLEPGADGVRRLTGFAVRPENWALAQQPAFTIAHEWEEVLPELAGDPSAEMWQEAWRSWCQQHRVSPQDADACRLELHDHRLLVQAPPAVAETLRGLVGEAAPDAWLLAGTGTVRRAARIEPRP